MVTLFEHGNKPSGSLKAEKVWTSRESINLSGRNIFHGVSKLVRYICLQIATVHKCLTQYLNNRNVFHENVEHEILHLATKNHIMQHLLTVSSSVTGWRVAYREVYFSTLLPFNCTK